MPLIRPNHLEQLAEQNSGRDRLGEILRRLVYCWAPNRVLGISFLSGDVNNFPGWDGWLRLAEAPRDSMEHRSVWQISVERNASGKIKQDFEKSFTANLPSDWVRSESVYVAVTPRKLKDSEKLEAQLLKMKGNPWRDVRIIDAVGLEQWIEKCPAVEAWLGEEFGIGAGQFGESLTRRWSRWSGATVPEISKELMLAGRDVKAIEEGLRFETDRVMAIQTDSPEESVALVHAVIASLPAPSQDRLLANALVVSSDARADRYAQQPVRQGMEPLTILVPPAASYCNHLERVGHRVVLAFGRKDPNTRSTFIKRALRSDFEKALRDSMNISAAEATGQTRACGSSVSIWRVWNLINTASPGDQKPIWARDDGAATRVIPAALIRSWDESCQGDREIVAEFCGQKYEEYRSSLQPHGVCDDPLFECVGTVFHIVAPAVAFTLLGRLITPTHLVALERATRAVFGEIEKDLAEVWESPPDDNPRIRERPKYSSWIRDGLAESLLSIAFLGQGLSSGALEQLRGGQEYVNRLLRTLPGLGTDPRMIASLRDQLPYLAEAAPIPFVEALESLLQGDPTRVKPLFTDRGFFGPTFQSGLLWALEVLAWSAEYLPRVTMILGRLHEIDPGGKVGNRPMNTLREIFLAWHPGTAASVEERVAAINHLYGKHPATAWQLLLKLMPNPHDIASPTQEPTWRDFGRSEIPELTNRAVAQCYRKYAELGLEVAENDLNRQIDLIDAYPQFPPEYKKRVVDMLNASNTKPFEEKVRVRAWNAIRKMLAHHKAFSDADWAMKNDELRPLEELGAMYLPADTIARHKWVLDDQWPETGFRAGDFEGNEQDIERRREVAVTEILAQHGWEGIHRLIRETQYPSVSAIALAKVVEKDTDLLTAFDVWAKERSRGQLWAIRSASRMRLAVSGRAWTDSLIARAKSSNWPDDALASAFIEYPPTMDTFQLIESLGESIAKYYWEHCWLHVAQINADTKKFAAEKYIQYGRAADVLNAVGKEFVDLGVELVLKTIGETIKQLSEQRLPADRNMFGYYLGKAFAWLRKQPEANPLEIARLEYPLLPLLTGAGHKEDSELTLHKLLAEDAGFFIQVLSDLYRPSTKPREQPVDDKTESRGTAAWRLLDSWELTPGLREDGSIEKEALTSWVTKARSLAREVDRADVADQHIGMVLYHAPEDPVDKSWPPIPVLDVIEKLDAKHVGRGFALECVNSRGVTSRAPLSGGDQERALENLWRRRAKALGAKWPRVRTLFEAIAEDWKGQAKWHDDDAAKLRMRWS